MHMYLNSILIFVLTLSNILQAENANNDAKNEMMLDSFMEEFEDENHLAEAITCIKNAVEPSAEKYIDMIYFQLFSDYIVNPCDEIREIWFDFDLTSSNNVANNVSDISELVKAYPELFGLVFTWIDNNRFPHDPQSYIHVAIDILSWLHVRKFQHLTVDDWCNPDWTETGINEYSNIATECFTLGSLRDNENILSDDDFANPLIRRLIPSISNNDSATISEKLEDAKEACLKLVNKGKSIAIQMTFAAFVSAGDTRGGGAAWKGYVPSYFGLSPIEIGLGIYLTLDGVIDIEAYFTYAFGLGFYGNNGPFIGNVLRDINLVLFSGDNTGVDYMGPSMAIGGGFAMRIQMAAVSFGIGLNAKAIFDWKPVKYLGWSIGLERSYFGAEIRVEFEPIIYSTEIWSIFNFNLSKICDMIPTIDANRINGTVDTSGYVDEWRNSTINLFYDAKDWWSSRSGAWDVQTKPTDNNYNTISSIASTGTSTADNIIWIGDQHEVSMQWESYSVTVDLKLTKDDSNVKYCGFIFGAKDVNNAYFFGITPTRYTFGYYTMDGEYNQKKGGNNQHQTWKTHTLEATLNATGYVVEIAVNGVNLMDDDDVLTNPNNDLRKGSVGLRTQKGGIATYTSVIVSLS